jgi:hypothetical protein
MRPTTIYVLTVLGSFLSVYAAQAEQSNSCKQCHDPQRACMSNSSAKTADG